MKKSPLFCLISAVCFMATPVFAEQPNPAPAPSSTAAESQQRTYTLDFPGGTLAQLMATLAKSGDGGINIIGDPADMATPLPAFSLTNASPLVLARALANFLENRGIAMKSAGLIIAGTNDVYTVKKRDAGGDPFESFQLAPYLENQKVDDIVGAIRTAWELDPAHEPAALRLKYHPPTSILIVSGPGTAIPLAARVISTLKRNPGDAPPLTTPKPAPAEKK